MLIQDTSFVIKVLYICVNCCLTAGFSRHITGFVTRLTRRVPVVEQDMLILPEFSRIVQLNYVYDYKDTPTRIYFCFISFAVFD